MSPQADEGLFDADFLSKLERLEFLARKLFRGLIHGVHPTQRRGHGLEFSDFRRYQPGDDLRFVDWNIYSRLDRLFLKLYASDEDLTLNLLLDCSASMEFGTPMKFDYARKVTAALGYIGLSNLDRVFVTTFSEGTTASLPVLTSKRQMAALLSHLRELSCAGTTRFADAMLAYAKRSSSPGVVVVITDLLGDDELYTGLESLHYDGHDVVLLHLLAETEISPPLDGPLSLVDAEDRSNLKVTVDAGLRQIYLRRLQTSLNALEKFCVKRRVEYLRASTAIPFEDLILKYLRQGKQWR